MTVNSRGPTELSLEQPRNLRQKRRIMPRRFFLLGILLGSFCWVGATAQTPLQTGDTLPEISGQTLSGKHLTLPADAAGKPAVVSFSFSRTGGKDSTLWSEHIEKDFPRASDILTH
jgi:hypothetical protein